MEQLTHYNTPFKKRAFPITLVADTITDAANVGSLFRTADAFGVSQIIFCGAPLPMGRKMTKTARATEKSVPFTVEEDINKVVTTLKTKGYCIIALEIASKSVSLINTTFQKDRPIALIVGDENFGVSQAVLNQSDKVVHIDMFGQNSSMNVVQATTIALYEIVRQIM